MDEKNPFYRNPEYRRMSVEIIRDAKKTIHSLSTKRPFTPRDEKRTLFGEGSDRNPDARPASIYSIGPRHFEGVESRPVSGTRLSPISHPPNLPSDLESKLLSPKPPPEESKPPRGKGSRLHPKLMTASYVDDRNEEAANRPSALKNPTKHSNSLSRSYSSVDQIQECEKVLSPLECSGSSIPCVSQTDRSSSKSSEQIINNCGKQKSSSCPDADAELLENQFFEEHLHPLLESLAFLKEQKSADQMLIVAENLFSLLESENLLGRKCRHRSIILKAVFKLLDYDHPAVLLSLSQLILSFQVTGKNLLNACKLVFKVSKNEQNDPLFLRGHILDQLLHLIRAAEPSCPDALIYCVGALKLLSGSSTLMKELVQKDCIETLIQLLEAINTASSNNSGCNSEQLGNLLVQLTACLRNLVDASGSRQRLLASSLIPALCCTMEIYLDDADLILNISRIFSKVSLHTDCCIVLADQKNSYQTLLKVLDKHLARQDVVVRICFVLGNLTAKNETARTLLFQEENALSMLQNVLQFYIDRSLQLNEVEESPVRNPPKSVNPMEEVLDVLIKTVRLIANLSVSETIGPIIAAHHQCVNQLMYILKNFTIEKEEDLLVTTVATINNLSYYHSKGSHISARYLEIAKCLINHLQPGNMEALLEAARVFANLTHQKAVRDFLAQNKVQEILIAVLDSNSREVVYICCGVLVNFMADREKRPILRKEGGIQKLVEVLRDFGPNDWQLSGIVCQVLLNYSRDITNTNACFGFELSQKLINILTEFLDDVVVSKMILSGSERDDSTAVHSPPMEVQQLIMEMWSCDFCPVAIPLLERLQKHLSPLKPMEQPEEFHLNS